MTDLSGKVAIVTGAARGLGAATAEELCKRGATVILADILDEVGADTTAKLVEQGYRAEYVTLDVTSEAGWAELVVGVEERHGGIDILVNNAGINRPPLSIEDATVEQFQTNFNVNVIGPFIGTKAVIPAMKSRGGGSIINISSNSTKKVFALTTMYGATKAALANLTKTSATHLAYSRTGIRVNSVHPGPHETAMLVGDESGVNNPMVQAMIEHIPMGRMGKPREVGATVAFLASDDASYITGAEIFVDGGVTNV
jgi:NAD(P)-dependent dehydrogenase (short-subunit alcohol dehydrogenase family)